MTYAYHTTFDTSRQADIEGVLAMAISDVIDEENAANDEDGAYVIALCDELINAIAQRVLLLATKELRPDLCISVCPECGQAQEDHVPECYHADCDEGW
jgi:hypothetical protein